METDQQGNRVIMMCWEAEWELSLEVLLWPSDTPDYFIPSHGQLHQASLGDLSPSSSA